MSCPSCASSNQAEFTAEVYIHFPGRKNLDKPGVFIFPQLSVCLDCGFSRFAAPETELKSLARGLSSSEGSARKRGLTLSHLVSEPSLGDRQESRTSPKCY
jgi:hypothetical protein